MVDVKTNDVGQVSKKRLTDRAPIPERKMHVEKMQQQTALQLHLETLPDDGNTIPH